MGHGLPACKPAPHAPSPSPPVLLLLLVALPLLPLLVLVLPLVPELAPGAPPPLDRFPPPPPSSRPPGKVGSPSVVPRTASGHPASVSKLTLTKAASTKRARIISGAYNAAGETPLALENR